MQFQNKITRLVILGLLMALWGPAAPALAQQELPAGWASRLLDDGTMAYKAINLPEGMRLNVWATDLDVGSLPPDHGDDIFQQAKAQHGLHRFNLPDAQVQCDKPPSVTPPQSSNALYVQLCRVSASDLAQPAPLMFLMLPRRSDLTRFIRVAMSQEVMQQPALMEGMKTVLSLEKERWIAEPYQAQPEPLRLQPPTQKAQTSASQQVNTPPSQGLRKGEYEAVLFSWDNPWIDGGPQYRETIYLLFNDGTAYSGLALPPEDFNVQASKRQQPERWVQWQKRGNTYLVRGPQAQEWTALKDAVPARPGGQGERLNNTYTHSSYTRNAWGGSASRQSFVFKPDGHFEQINYAVGGAQGGDVTTLATQGNSGAGSYSNNNATITKITEPALVTGGSSRRQRDGANYTGTYRIDNYTLELHRDNGTVERLLFLHSTPDGINIGGQGYLRKKS